MIKSLLIVLVFVTICHFYITNGYQDPEEEAMDGSRAIDFKTKKKSTTTPRPTWRPAVPGKELLTQQKGLAKPDEEDPEFIYIWPDDYYDDYTFESKKTMLQHGTFESKIQNYHEAEFAEAIAKLKEQNEKEGNATATTTEKA